MSGATPIDSRFDRGEHRSLRAAIFGAIRREIISGSLEPGKLIRIKEMQGRFRVGLSAVREALCQLAADGLVIAEDQRGFRVAPVSETDLRDLTRARAEIEIFLIRDAIANGDTDWEAHLLAAYHRLANVPKFGSAYAEKHRAFHDTLVAPCTSDWMKRFRATLHHHSERYRLLAATHNDAARDIDGEHRALMEAALARESDLAAELIAAHVHETAQILMRNGLTAP